MLTELASNSEICLSPKGWNKVLCHHTQLKRLIHSERFYFNLCVCVPIDREGIGSSGIVVISSCELPNIGLGIKFRFSGRVEILTVKSLSSLQVI